MCIPGTKNRNGIENQRRLSAYRYRIAARSLDDIQHSRAAGEKSSTRSQGTIAANIDASVGGVFIFLGFIVTLLIGVWP